jgi:glycerol-3-phosphate acyltransferase PlsY
MLKYLFIILAYLIGSIPFSYILGKYIKKDDIRKHGSGNLGTTNAFRVFGAFIGISVLILDTLKSGLFILFIQHTNIFDGVEMFPSIIYGAVAVIGHVFPIWMKFKGGKGVASAFGVLLFYYWPLAVCLLPVFLLTLKISKYASLASTVATTLSFIVGLILYLIGFREELFNLLFVITTGLMMIIILFKHQSNFRRIIDGNENRVNFRKKT